MLAAGSHCGTQLWAVLVTVGDTAYSAERWKRTDSAIKEEGTSGISGRETEAKCCLEVGGSNDR